MPEPLLAIGELRVGYGPTEILRGVDLVVGEGEIVAVLGSNGTGKSTLNRTISGVMRATHGTIRFMDAAIEREPPKAIVARGLIHVPEGRRIFPNLTVGENLDLGAYRRAGARRGTNRSRVFSIFPRLLERQGQRAGTLSGGEQQMLAIGRILRTGAKLLLLDEPTEGLAPVIVQQIGAVIRTLKQKGFTILLVEQNFRFAATLADRHYVVEHGQVIDMIANDALDANIGKLHEYLGV